MRVSVVIPCYNAERFLAQSITSVLSQTRRVDEVLVVDDCSSDSSTEIASRFGVTLLSTERNGGAGPARNVGIRRASGDVVAFLDADDIWLPGHCEALTDLLARHPEAVAALSAIHVDPEMLTPGESGWDVPTRVQPGKPVALLEQLLLQNVVPQSAVMVRRDVLLEVGGYRPHIRFAEDYDLWLRVAARGPFVSTPEVTVRYRLHAAQAMQNSSRLIDGSWTARLDAVAPGGAAHGILDSVSIERVFREAFSLQLREAWFADDDPTLTYLLSLASTIPGGNIAARPWVWRKRLLWRLRLVARRALKQLRMHLRSGALR